MTLPRLRSLAAPLFFELCVGVAAGLAGMVLAARMSDTAGAAFALASHVSSMLFILFRIVGAGVSVVVAQSLGAGQRATADRVARATLGASSWIGAAVAAMAIVGAQPLMQLLSAPADVLPLAAPLLMALAPGLMLDAWNASMASVTRAHLLMRETLVIILLTQAAQLGLTLLLMPILGLYGFAAAMAISRALGLALHLSLWRTRLQLRPLRSDWWRMPRPELAAVLRIGLPGAAENIAYRLAFMVSVVVAGQLGAQALATQAYVQQIGLFALLFGISIGLAAEIVIGRLIGGGRLREANRLMRRALGSGLLISVAVTAAVALAGPSLLRQFSTDPDIVAAGAVLLVWTILLEPGRTFNVVVINALRAAGDARFPVVAGAASMVLVLAGGSWLLGHTLGLGLVGVWIAYCADEWLRGLIMWWRWSSLGWVPHARAARRRSRITR